MTDSILATNPTGGAEDRRRVMQPALRDVLMEGIVAADNMRRAWRQVRRNRGAPGIDGMRIEDFPAYARGHWPTIRQALLDGTYRPQPVRRVSIPKPDGGERLLGIPTVVDRLIQQGIAQIMGPMFDSGFSESSFGFRPRRGAHGALRQVQASIKAGYRIAVDLDLAKFFDNVQHEPSEIGTPQGGPLSPLLANILLDDLDRELERRGHRFARYADDVLVLVRSPRAGERVKASLTGYLTKRLKLQVNEQKSRVAPIDECTFLGFTFRKGKLRWSERAFEDFQHRVRELTGRSWGVSMRYRFNKLAQYLRGWMGYFGISEYYRPVPEIDEWLRRRMRMCYWKQWRLVRTKVRHLLALGVGIRHAILTAISSKSYWRMSKTLATQVGMTNQWLKDQGLISVRALWMKAHGYA